MKLIIIEIRHTIYNFYSVTVMISAPCPSIGMTTVLNTLIFPTVMTSVSNTAIPPNVVMSVVKPSCVDIALIV